MRQFVADASHELRTPLTAIRGFAEYYRQCGGVADEALSHPELDRLIERVESEATRMGVLVDDMLLLARLDQERPLEFRTVDLLAIAADALHDARVIAPQRTRSVVLPMPSTSPPRSRISRAITSTSLIRGTLVRTHSSFVSRHAASKGSAAFLLPSTSTAPESRWPPSIRSVDIT